MTSMYVQTLAMIYSMSLICTFLNFLLVLSQALLVWTYVGNGFVATQEWTQSIRLSLWVRWAIWIRISLVGPRLGIFLYSTCARSHYWCSIAIQLRCCVDSECTFFTDELSFFKTLITGAEYKTNMYLISKEEYVFKCSIYLFCELEPLLQLYSFISSSDWSQIIDVGLLQVLQTWSWWTQIPSVCQWNYPSLWFISWYVVNVDCVTCVLSMVSDF